jgi:flagellar FliJ protein
MGVFKFRLETLLNVKIQLEKNIKNELGKAMQKLEVEKNFLKTLESELDSYINGYKKTYENAVTIRYVKEISDYLITLKKRIEFQEKTINKFEKSVDIIRAKLIKVVQEKNMLEKLKEKDKEKYIKEELIKEQKLNDEIASYKHLTTYDK